MQFMSIVSASSLVRVAHQCAKRSGSRMASAGEPRGGTWSSFKRAFVFRILSSCFSISLASCTCFLLCLARLSEAFCFNLFACQLGAFSLHAHYVLS